MGDCSDIKYEYDSPVWEKVAKKTSWDTVIEDIRQREDFGYKKYGKYLTVDTDEDMLQHLYEELLDATVYIKTLINQRKVK